MITSPDSPESYAQILLQLKSLETVASNSDHTQHTQRLTLNHRVLTQLQVNIYKRDPSFLDVGPSELLVLKRGTVFNWSSLKSSIDFFRWSRAVAVEELAAQAHQSGRDSSLLMSMFALRSILELTGNAALLEKDLHALAEPSDDAYARIDWLKDVESLIDGRLAGVRVDYTALTQSGLRGTKRFSYKPGELEDDRTAKDLLNGVDALDKRVKGARATYEFFSEFVHPNLASSWINYERTETRLQVSEVYGYAAHHYRRRIGSFFLETFGHLISEGVDIVVNCVDELRRIDSGLKAMGVSIAKHAKKSIREVIKKDPKDFDFRESCPCNSGVNIRQCCGKLIKVGKFGRFTAAS